MDLPSLANGETGWIRMRNGDEVIVGAQGGERSRSKTNGQVFCLRHRLFGILWVCATLAIAAQDRIESSHGAAVAGVSHGRSGAVTPIAKRNVNSRSALRKRFALGRAIGSRRACLSWLCSSL